MFEASLLLALVSIYLFSFAARGEIVWGSFFPRDSETILYAACQDEDVDKNLRRCNVTVETKIFSIQAEYKDTCSIIIEDNVYRSINVFQLENHYDLLPLSIDRVLLNWIESSSGDKVHELKYKIIDMLACNESIDRSFFFDEERYFSKIPVLYGDKFEVFVGNSSVCGQAEECLLALDSGGQQLSEPKPFASLDKSSLSSRSVPVVSLQAQKGFHVHRFDYANELRPQLRLSYVDAAGTSIDLASLATSVESAYPRSFDSAHSNANHLYGVCASTKAEDSDKSVELLCAQFDIITPRLNLRLKLAESWSWMAMHNVAPGEVALLLGNCDAHGLCRGYRLLWLGPEGRKGRSLVKSDFAVRCARDGIHASLTEHEFGLYCVRIVCVQYDNETEEGRIVTSHHKDCMERYVALNPYPSLNKPKLL